MGRLILITGGGRSGKSDFALKLAHNYGRKVCFIATCEALDEEMNERIEWHKKKRPGSWKTVEEPLKPDEVIKGLNKAAVEVVLMDCVTLWLSNLILKGTEPPQEELEDYLLSRVQAFTQASRKFSGATIVVTNEVGMGIVPENKLARIFRDVAGRCNQKLALEADEVYFLISGIPLKTK